MLRKAERFSSHLQFWISIKQQNLSTSFYKRTYFHNLILYVHLIKNHRIISFLSYSFSIGGIEFGLVKAPTNYVLNISKNKLTTDKKQPSWTFVLNGIKLFLLSQGKRILNFAKYCYISASTIFYISFIIFLSSF